MQLEPEVKAEKKTAKLPEVRVSETMEIDLMRRAVHENRKLSDYIRHVLSRHLYGVVRTETLADED